jgi:hypothetical protein
LSPLSAPPPPFPQPFLEAHLTSSEGHLFSKADLSTALLALVALLPDVVEDVPKAPLLAAEQIGHFMGAGHLSFDLAELATAIKEAGRSSTGAAQGRRGEEGQNCGTLSHLLWIAPAVLG